MAAALTYHTLFSLLPTLVLMLVVSSALVGEADRARFKDQAVSWALEWLEAPAPSGAVQQHGEGAEPTVLEGLAEPLMPDVNEESALLEAGRQAEFERAREALSENLQAILDTLESVNLSGIGVIGLLVFIYGATGLLATIEGSFNRVYKAQENRPWYLRMVFYYFTITMAPAVILAGQVMQQRFIEVVGAGSWTQWLAGPMVLLSPLVTTWLVMSFAFVLLPNTRVSTRRAAVGGLVAAIGVVAAGELYGLYVQQAGATSLYGALALLPLSLFYLWILWLIVLFGLEVAYTLQTMPAEGLPASPDQDDQKPMLLTGSALIAAALAVARAFTAGGVVSTGTVSQKLGISMDAADALLDRLEAHEIIQHVEGKKAATTGWSLARPPGSVRLDQLVALAHEASPLHHRDPAIQGVIDRQIHASADQSLEDLLAVSDSR